MIKVLAIDLGATSGRAMLGNYSNENVNLIEINRFKDYVIREDETINWDVQKIMSNIYESIIIADKKYGFDSIAIDTWGVDFGLIDKSGKLIRNPVHYRDPRTKGIIKLAKEYMDLEELYEETGIQIMEINTLFQLLHLKIYDKEIYNKIDSVLLMPDLINYLLTGKKYAEKTIASTTQLFNPVHKSWSSKVIENFNIDKTIFPEIIDSGKVIGKIKKELKDELSLLDEKKVISVASHDTASAILSVPTEKSNFTFLSSGTWSLLGQALNDPIINDYAKENNIANEVGAKDTITFLKNLTGLWILEESLSYYRQIGQEFTYEEIQEIAVSVGNVDCYIDVDNKTFSNPDNMPEAIRKYAHNTKQEIPETPAEVFKVIYQSLACKYRQTEKTISDVTRQTNEEVYIVGGGSQSTVLSQMTSNILNKKVIAGPSEATSIGNIVMQLIALEEIKDISSARRIIRNMDEIHVYYPQDVQWEERYEKYLTRNNIN